MTQAALPSPIIIAPRGDLPILLSVPHSGRDYPDWLLADATGGRAALESLEDPLVDRLAWRALALGLGAVIATTPRAAIDCNRAPEEIDPAVIANAPPAASPRARSGLGIIPGRTALHGHLWHRPVSLADLAARIAAAHAPYHAAIERGLDRIAIANSAAILLDCHSMPTRHGQAEIVIGDRHGTSAAPHITAAAARIARASGWTVALNQPYAGGHIVERHGQPRAGIHALQIEIDRHCYLAVDGRTPGPGFDRAARLLESLVIGLAGAIAEQLPLAAE